MLKLSDRHFNFIQIAVVLFALFLVYYSVIASMIADWSTNENYSHGFLVPIIFGCMIYSMRHQLKEAKVEPSAWGLIIISAGLCQFIIAKIGYEYFLQRSSLLIVLFGICLYFWGTRVASKMAIPIGYLIFMIPVPAIIWNRVAFPMQLFSSGITEYLLQLFGIPVFRQGNILHLAVTTLEVVDACSGLRSLVSMFALSAAFAFLVNMTRLKKLLLFLSAAPIAISINILRLVVTAILARWIGGDAAQGFLHDFSGILLFIMGLFMLFGFQFMLSKGDKKKRPRSV